jgi:hypothetical protein
VKKYLAVSIFIVMPCLLHAQDLFSDSLHIPQFHRYAGYVAVGFPLGIGVEGIYRPLNEIAFSLGGNLSLPFPYLMPTGRPSISAGLSFPVESIDIKGHQDGISASIIILAATDNFDRLNTVALSYGSMPGSQSVFNWKIGAMFFLLDHASTFAHRIEGIPILSISWRIF